MRVMVAGSGRLGAGIIDSIQESSHEVVALVQNAREQGALNRVLNTAVYRQLGGPSNAIYMANKYRIPIVWIRGSKEEDVERLLPFEPDVLLTCGFSIILKKPLLEMPKVAAVNCHSSLLPNHRGPMPFAAAILAGRKESGVTFHIMDEGIDTGPILDQFSFALTENETALSLYRKAAETATDHVVEVLDRLDDEGVTGRPQDPTAGSYDKKLKREDTFLDWNDRAVQLERMVRACYPFTVARFRYKRRTIIVGRARFDAKPVDAAPGTVLRNRPFVEIATGEGTFTPLLPYHFTPYPFVWPAPWNRPKIGSRIE